MTQEILVKVNQEDSAEDSEAEEALSLCDLPIKGEDGGNSTCISNSKKDDLPTSYDQDLFEFSNGRNAETMRSAEDIIFCGKLLPYKSAPLFPDQSNNKTARNEYPNKFLHRKSESLNDLQRSQSTAKPRFTRSSYSLDYQKLHRDSSGKLTRAASSAPSSDGISSGNCFGKCDFSVKTPRKTKWRLLMFGYMKPPTEMELKDIRNRQSRRNPSALIPTNNGEKMVSRDDGKASWKVLRALSCKGETNDVITASFRCIPHV